MLRVKLIFLSILLIFITSNTKALAQNISYVFNPDNPSITVSEGDTAIVEIIIDDTVNNAAPDAYTIDSTGFTSINHEIIPDVPNNLTKLTLYIGPDYDDEGTHRIHFTAYDSNDIPKDTLLTIIINNTNRAPQLTNLPHTLFVDENVNIQYTVTAFDPDTDPVTLSAENVPSNATFTSGTGLFDFTPDFSQSGVDSVRIIASDGSLADTSYLILVVNNVNIAPDIDNQDTTININEGQSYSFAISASDYDGDQLIYSLLPPDTNWVNFSDTTVLIGLVPYDIADFNTPVVDVNFNIIISDGSLADTIDLTIRVANINRPPVFSYPSQDTVLTVYQPDTNFIVFTAADADSNQGENLEFIDIDSIRIRTELTEKGWYIRFNLDSLFFSPSDSIEGFADSVGYKFVVKDQADIRDTIIINFFSTDTIPPETITSFDGANSGQPFGKIRLYWTAPHEDYNDVSSGAVSAYYIKYAVSAPANSNDMNWWNNTAQYIQQQPPHPPGTPGSSDSVIVNELAEYQNYWYGIMAEDASGNSSIFIRTNPISPRWQAPQITFTELDTVAPGTEIVISGVVSDSGGIIYVDSISYSTDNSTWYAVDSVGPAYDESDMFIRRYFQFSLAIVADDTLVYVRAMDAQNFGATSLAIYIDNTPPNTPSVTSSPSDSLTNNSNFYFAGTKEQGTSVWAFLELGSNPGTDIQIAETGDTSSHWDDTIAVYFQGPVHFRFYAKDEAGNASDSTARYSYYLDTEPPFIVGSPAVTQFTNEQQVSAAVMNILFSERLDISTVELNDFVIFNQQDTLDADTSETRLIFLESAVRIDFSETATSDFINLISQSTSSYPRLSVADSVFTDLAGNNIHDTSITLESNLNVMIDSTIDFNGTTNFNPDSTSFTVSFQTTDTSYFVFTILNEQGSIIYNLTIDSLGAGSHTYTWNDTINTGTDSGQAAPDGWYRVRLSARPYPVSPYDLPVEVVIYVDSYAPFESYFFPNSGFTSASPRIIDSDPQFVLAVGDTGAVGLNTRADIINPFLKYLPSGSSDSVTITFTENDSTPGQWEADLTSSPLTSGTYEMVLVIADSAGNKNIYYKYYEVTSASGISGFFNYPNPFAPSVEQTVITYTLTQNVNELDLEIFDTSGDLIYRRVLDGADLEGNTHEISWDGKSAWGKTLNNGVYFARLTGDITSEFLKIAIADR